MDINSDFVINNDNLNNKTFVVLQTLSLPLPEELPNPIPLVQLMEKAKAEMLQRLVYETIRINNCRDARELISRLRLVDNLKSVDQQLYKFYQKLIILLKFVSFIALKPKDFRYLLMEGIIAALRAKVEVVDNIRDFFELYEGGVGIEKQMRRELIYALENNKENIGEQSIKLEDKGRVAPSLQNWLKSYNSSQPLTAGRSRFNQINFLNTNQNVLILSSEDKKILAQVLEIYDWLLFPPPLPEIIPDEEYMRSSEYTALQRMALPADLFKKTDLDVENFKPLEPAVLSKPTASPPVVSKPNLPPVKAVQAPAKPSAPPKPFISAEPPEELPQSPGLSFIKPPAEQVKPPLKASAPSALVSGSVGQDKLTAQQIDKKLEELKQKAEKRERN